jgi:hypothetical protein
MQLEKSSRIGEEDLAFAGEEDPFAGAIKEPAANLFFQATNLLTHGGLGQEELPGGFRETAGCGDLVKGLEKVYVHKKPLSEQS